MTASQAVSGGGEPSWREGHAASSLLHAFFGVSYVGDTLFVNILSRRWICEHIEV